MGAEGFSLKDSIGDQTVRSWYISCSQGQRQHVPRQTVAVVSLGTGSNGKGMSWRKKVLLESDE